MGILIFIAMVYAFVKMYINFGIPRTLIFAAIYLFFTFVVPLFGWHYIVPFVLKMLTLIVMLMMIRWEEAGP